MSRYYVTHGSDEHEVSVRDLEDGTMEVSYGGRTLAADVAKLAGEDILSLLLDGFSFEVMVAAGRAPGTLSVTTHGSTVEFTVESDRERNARLISAEGAQGTGEIVRAVMPGIVVGIAVGEGDAVKPGQSLLVLEAMKMENDIRASCAGIVSRIAVSRGQTVNGGDVLVEIRND